MTRLLRGRGGAENRHISSKTEGWIASRLINRDSETGDRLGGFPKQKAETGKTIQSQLRMGQDGGI